MPPGQQFIEARHQIVAADDGETPVAKPRLFEDRARLRRTAGRVHAARVGDDLQVRLAAQDRSEAFENVEEVGGEPADGSRCRCSARIDMVSSARYSSVR